MTASRLAAMAVTALCLATPSQVRAQEAVEGEVRQLVTFLFEPGRAQEAFRLYEAQAIPLYRENSAMLSFRGLREVESPTPLDLVVVSGFSGMAGMDASNAALRTLAQRAGTSIGALYGQIGGMAQSHYDEFVEMLPELGQDDPSDERLVALVRYRIVPGAREAFLDDLAQVVVPWERSRGTAATTGRFILADGWDVLRFIGFEDLADYHMYWSDMQLQPWYEVMYGRVAAVRQTVLAPMPFFSVR